MPPPPLRLPPPNRPRHLPRLLPLLHHLLLLRHPPPPPLASASSLCAPRRRRPRPARPESAARRRPPGRSQRPSRRSAQQAAAEGEDTPALSSFLRTEVRVPHPHLPVYHSDYDIFVTFSKSSSVSTTQPSRSHTREPLLFPQRTHCFSYPLEVHPSLGNPFEFAVLPR